MIMQDKINEIVRQYAQKKDRHIEMMLELNDWGEYPVVDFVWVQPDMPMGPTTDLSDFKFGEGVKFVRHGRKAPPIEDSHVEGKRCEIQRVTKPLYEKMIREHPEAFSSSAYGEK